MDAPHVIVIPYPAQGHVKPLLELSHCLVRRGFQVTFVNTEFDHRRVMAAMSNRGEEDGECGRIYFESVPDGLEPEDDRNQLAKLNEMMRTVMPRHLEKLIKKISESSKIKCVIADLTMDFVFEVVEKMEIPRAAFWTSSGALLASGIYIPKLIEAEIIDSHGALRCSNNQMIHLSPAMPAMNTADFVWLCMGDSATNEAISNVMFSINHTLKLINYLLCNTFYELEPFVLELAPTCKPIGPLVTNYSRGNFWAEDSTCLAWLDQHPPCSVVYAAFGSFTTFNKTQFEQLAYGLELMGRPFLWVVRADVTGGTTGAVEYPNGFMERVGSVGRMVSWAPQKDVLAHPSIGCFLSHCGWNSTMEGLSNGVPFLCWPYFGDQFLNASYISDVWKVGLRLEKDDENGIISREEIKEKVDEVLGDEVIKTNSLKLKELAARDVSHGGASQKNLEDFIHAIL